MSRIGKTKKEILKLLSKKQQTITDISNKLGLSPSTIKQHFDELVNMGAIEQVENEFIKRWKYYKVVPSFNIEEMKQERKESSIKEIFPYAVGALIAIGIVSVIFLYNSNSNNITSGITGIAKTSSNASYYLSIQIIDPPHVPQNTTALFLNYSSLSVNVLKSNGTYEWINSTNGGTLNLMSLINVSSIIANTNVKSNDIIKGIALKIKNSSIVINNNTYPVYPVTNYIYANISSNSLVDSNSSILIDFSPTVSSVYTDNGTTFVMYPVVKALFYSNYKNNGKALGSKFTLNNSEFTLINRVYQLRQNLEVTYSNISTYNNKTKIVVTVKNIGNKTVNLTQIIVSGKINTKVIINKRRIIFINNMGDKDFNINVFGNGNGLTINKSGIVKNISLPNINNKFGLYRWNMSNMDLNVEHTGIDMAFINQIALIVNKNGTLSIPQPTQSNLRNMFFNNVGYPITPGSSQTFTFYGNMSCANGFIIGELSNNASYHVLVISSSGSFNSINTMSNIISVDN
ncbi:MAG: ArsR family transcriptional regulator [Candidatus Micrarchaeia archaeon]